MANNEQSPVPSTINQYFLHPIGSSTLSRIKIPIPFFKRFEKEEHGKQAVTLMSAQKRGEWNVIRENRTLKDGWKEFTKDLCLQVNDYVIFKHKGNSVFEVTTLGPNGSQLNYMENKSSQSTSQAGTIVKIFSITHSHILYLHRLSHVSGTSARSKNKVAMEGMDPGSPAMSTKETKVYKKTVPGEPNAFYQIVTDSNIGKNSVYIPASFVNFNSLEDKCSELTLLTNKEGDAWEATATLCVDGRIQLASVWSIFCAENSIEVGDCCKFNLVEDPEHIIFQFAGITNGAKKQSQECNLSPPRPACKEEQYSSQEKKRKAAHKTTARTTERKQLTQNSPLRK